MYINSKRAAAISVSLVSSIVVSSSHPSVIRVENRMYNQIICALVIVFALSAVFADDFTSQNEVLDYGHDREPVIYGFKNESVAHPNIPKDTWFDSARYALAGPAGRIVITMAKEMLARSTGNSQVMEAMFV